MQFWDYVLIIFVFFNILSLVLYGIDKNKAEKNRRRISEKTLLFWSFLGPFGAYIGMKLFHHKTQKAKFYISIPLFCLLHAVAVFGYFSNYAG